MLHKIPIKYSLHPLKYVNNWLSMMWLLSYLLSISPNAEYIASRTDTHRVTTASRSRLNEKSEEEGWGPETFAPAGGSVSQGPIGPHF